MKKIYLCRDKRAYALVDDEDYKTLSQFHWMLKTDGYAYRQEYRSRRVVLNMLMHHQIIGKPPQGMVTDHINHNPLDNRRSNLRFVTSKDNQLNRKGLQRNNSTGYNGVVRYRGGGKILKYAATIKRDGIMHHVGVFSTPEKAHIAREVYLAGGK